MLRKHFGFVESVMWEGPDININKVACDIIRELVADAAFDILTGGGDKPTIEIHPGSIQRFRKCQCSDPLVKCDSRGCRCTSCGLPA